MKTRKKILVLSGLKKDLENTIKSATSLANLIDAEVDFFYVKRPTEIVDRESQLSALRTINREQVKTEKTLNSLLEPYKVKYGFDIKPRFSFGNIKSEIKQYIKKTNPDVIVLGKRKNNLFKLIGDKVTDFILNEFSGPVLIASNSNMLEPQKDLSVGVLNSEKEVGSEKILSELLKQTTTKVKSFKIIEKGNTLNDSDSREKNTVEYVFEKSGDTLSKLSNYIEKSNVDILYINKNQNISKPQNKNTILIKQIINKVDIPLLLAN